MERNFTLTSVFTDFSDPGLDVNVTRVYAVWSPTAAVPLPAGLPLVLTELGALVGLQWRRKRAAEV